jgi:DnaJ-class molecular chaperone
MEKYKKYFFVYVKKSCSVIKINNYYMHITMDMSNTFYNILDISKTATSIEIKKAYRKMSMKWHPDKNKNSKNSHIQFQKIGEAYETLKDEKLKREYDESLQTLPNLMRMPTMYNEPKNNLDLFGENGPPTNLEDILSRLFAQNERVFLEPIEPIIETVYITLEQAFYGANKMVTIERKTIHPTHFTTILEDAVIYVDIQQGIDVGERIVIKNSGHIFADGRTGDVHIIVQINKHTIFNRIGLDLIMTYNISLKESLCGFTFEIKHLSGELYTINNARGNIIPTNHKKTIPKLGMGRNTHVGNLIIQFEINFPTTLSEVQLSELDKLLE